MSFLKSSLSVYAAPITCLVALLVFLCAGGVCLAGDRPQPGVSAGFEVPLTLPDQAGSVTPKERQRALKALDLSPAVFIENRGQWDSDIRYGFDGKGVRVSFTDSGPVFQMLRSDRKDASIRGHAPTDSIDKPKFTQAVFSATFVGAKAVRPVALDPSSSRMNFYRGNDKSRWQSGVPTYSKILYKGLYDGVDLYTWGRRAGLKYEFHVSPGASWAKVVIRYDGIEGLSLDDSGALHVRTALGEMVDKAPVVYQVTSQGRKEVPSRFRLIDAKSCGFQVTGEYDGSLPLVLDPDIAWASFLGGSSNEDAAGIAIDGSGNAWVTGSTQSSDFPTSGGFDTSLGGVIDAFVAKITPSGALAWASFLGGSGSDISHGIAIDASGNALVTGETWSSDFPVPGGFDTSYGGGGDAFVARITPSGELAWASFLGGSGDEKGWSIATDASRSAWVTGETYSSEFPVPGAFDTTLGGEGDAFVAKITPFGKLAWASFLGGSNYDHGYAIATDASGNAWVTGFTQSSDFPVPGGFDTSNGGFVDAFVARITPSGKLAWASFLGGSASDYGLGIATDASGNALVTGYTESSDFPVPGGFDTTFGGYHDAFVAKITPSGALAWASFLGGSSTDYGYEIATDASGNALVTGYTESSDFPVAGGFDTSYGGGGDAFVARIMRSSKLGWASFLGGGGTDYACGIAIDAWHNAWVAGYTESSNFPVPGGFDLSLGGLSDAFVTKILTPDTDWLDVADWLKIDKLQISMPPSGGRDSFVLTGSFNMCVTGIVPQTVTLTIDGWSVVMDASLWKRAGKSNTYSFKDGGVSGKITYWSGGTSRCLFSFSASGQTLQGSLPNRPSLPVRLQLGGGFDEAVIAETVGKNTVAKLSCVGPAPAFLVDRLAMTRNLRQWGRDMVKFSGRLFLTRDFDPASEVFCVGVGAYEFYIPAGSMPAAKNGLINYSQPTANGKRTVRLNMKTHTVVLTATGIDLSSLTRECFVTLWLPDHAGADLHYGVFPAVNKAGTAYKY